MNREVPFDGLDQADIAAMVIKGEQLKDHSLNQIDIRLSDLVSSCRGVDPSQRPSFQIIVEVLNEVHNSM